MLIEIDELSTSSVTLAKAMKTSYVICSKNGWLRFLSDYTSIQRRINSAMKGEQPPELLPFVGNERPNMPNGLMFSVKDYIVLVEDTGRIIREDKRGAISSSSQDILNRLNIPAENWLKITTEFGALFKGAVGALPALTEYCEHLDRKRRQGAANCQRWLCA
jgi:hypothetical protein